MKLPYFLVKAQAFILLHRLVALIAGVIILCSILLVIILSPSREVELDSGPLAIKPPRISLDEGLPARTLESWGVDPFRDVLKDMETARLKREEEERIRLKQEAERIAREEADRIAREEADRVARAEAERLDKEKREREGKEAKERDRRRQIILSIRVRGIIYDPKGRSTVIIEDKSYTLDDIVVKGGVEAAIVGVDQSSVTFKDPLSGDTYSVPISR
jgi:hypothetical protein